MKFLSSNKGMAMSLLEIVIAVAVGAVILGGGAIAVGTYVDDSKKVKAQAEVSMLEIAISQYNIDYPSSKITAINSTSLSTLKTQGYIQKNPAFDGTDGCSYSYETVNSSSQKHVVLKGCKFTKGNISVY